MSNVVQVLKDARRLVAENWGQGNGLNDPKGCHCIYTAVYDVSGGVDSRFRSPALRTLCRSANLPPDGEIWDWNDAPGRTQSEVLALFDKAIASLAGLPT